MPDDTELVDYYDYFTEKELNEFIPAFLEEGVIHERLSILPVAKSTEDMFVNKTAFARFAKETGEDIEDLRTWEGLFAMSEQYAEWTDNKTPKIPHDGKNFFVHDYHFNYFQVDAEKGEGPAFVKTYPATGYPTFYYIYGKGEVLRTFTGAKNVHEFVQEGKMVNLTAKYGGLEAMKKTIEAG